MESFSIELIEVIVHKFSKNRCFRNIGRTYNKNTHSEIQLQIIGCNFTTMPADIKNKKSVLELGI